ncbi:MAG TPA: Gfo/Idh/MocA family oxidoreductase [Candidatus Binatia bacterium]|jgi:predicted dehydrogenase
MTRSDKLAIGVIGCGHWGPNHVRVFSQSKDCSVIAVADPNEERLRVMRERFPELRAETDYRALLEDPRIQAVVIAAPTSLHGRIAGRALEMNKHVLCEKPLCIDAAEGAAVVRLARKKQLVLMVGHVFLFNPGIVRMKHLIDADEIGEVRYVSAVRTNLGPVRSDVNAVYDLAAHDIAVFNWLLGSEPFEVRAMGAAFIRPGIEDVAIVTMKYPGGVLASIQCSWLDPKKTRQMTIVGSKRMITWDDLAPNPVAIYEKSVAASREITDYGEFLRVSMFDGDVRFPKLPAVEPLRAQAAAFVEAIRRGSVERSDGAFGLGVVRILNEIDLELVDRTKGERRFENRQPTFAS